MSFSDDLFVSSTNCMHCGEPLEKGYSWCRNCGTPIGETTSHRPFTCGECCHFNLAHEYCKKYNNYNVFAESGACSHAEFFHGELKNEKVTEKKGLGCFPLIVFGIVIFVLITFIMIFR